jgi:Zn-dependent protease
VSVATFSGRRTLVLSRRPVPIILTRGGIAPVALLAAGFALYTAGGPPRLVLGAALVGGLGGAASLIVHELGHVRASRRLDGVRAAGISLRWFGAATHFEGAYRSGRQQAKVALGGPAASFVFALALTVAAALPLPGGLQYACFGLGLLNATIAVLTLIPVHPLDGHKLIVGLVWCAAGAEARARAIVRRVGLACVALDASIAAYVLIEHPVIGAFVVVMGSAAYAQKRLVGSGSGRASPKT